MPAQERRRLRLSPPLRLAAAQNGSHRKSRDIRLRASNRASACLRQDYCSQGGSPLGETKSCVTKGGQFFGNISQVPRSQKLAFFHIDCAPRFRGSAQQIRLTAKKRWDL